MRFPSSCGAPFGWLGLRCKTHGRQTFLVEDPSLFDKSGPINSKSSSRRNISVFSVCLPSDKKQLRRTHAPDLGCLRLPLSQAALSHLRSNTALLSLSTRAILQLQGELHARTNAKQCSRHVRQVPFVDPLHLSFWPFRAIHGGSSQSVFNTELV